MFSYIPVKYYEIITEFAGTTINVIQSFPEQPNSLRFVKDCHKMVFFYVLESFAFSTGGLQKLSLDNYSCPGTTFHDFRGSQIQDSENE